MAPHLTDREKWAVIDRVIWQHQPVRVVARDFHSSISTIQRTLQLFADTGDVVRRRGSGRPRLLDADARRALNTALSSTPRATNQECADYLVRHGARRVSMRTLQRARKVEGWYQIKERVVKTLTPAQKAARLEFTSTREDQNWKHVVFSDEKMFTVKGAADYVWTRKGDPRPIRQVRNFRGSGQVMVWGAVWYWGRSTLCFTTVKINSDKYQEILSTHLLPSMPLTSRFLFQQDGAPCHTSTSTTSFLSTYAVPVLTPWPSDSPDFNPIESVWSWMVRVVNGWRSTSVPELRRAIQHAWDSIPQETIQAYIDHLPRQLQAVREAEGDRAL